MIGKLFDHYRIIDQLGSGGMGIVYKAEDTQLGRFVALKFLPLEMAQDRQALERFKQEARAASALNHPHICAIYELAEHQGRQYIVMELLEGDTLEHRIAGRPMTTEQVAKLGVQICEALEAAHAKGIVHRDLKPTNVIVSDQGRVKVLDFGLAKSMLTTSNETIASRLTEAGVTVGTLPYMAPEQVRAQNADSRTDIYALGCVLYEMATGQRPFRDPVAARLTDEILHKPPPPPGRLNPDLPPELERCILKCLDKDPENRYQSAKEVAVDLRRHTGSGSSIASESFVPLRAALWSGWRKVAACTAALVVVVGLLIALNVGGVRNRLRGHVMPVRIESLAVLPLDNLSRDPQQEYFADGMTEALIAELSKIRALKVISRTSVMQYKRARRPLPQIAQELDVDGVVEGSVVRDGNQVRITVELIDGETDRHLWTESYQREMQGILALQSSVAQAIAEEIKIAVSPEEKARLARNHPVNPEAYEAYLKGRHFWDLRTLEGLDKALEYFEKAVQIDPQYALAYAGQADTYLVLGDNNYRPSGQTFPKAIIAVRKALELDESLAEAHTTQAAVLEEYDWDWKGAEREFSRALDLNPGYATAHHWYAEFLTCMGRYAEGMAEIKKARTLDPFSPRINSNFGRFLYYARRYDEAIQELLKLLELQPNDSATHAVLSSAYSEKGMHQKAIAEAQQAIQDGAPQGDLKLARILARAGKRQEARKMIDRARLSKREYISSDYLALAYVALGESDTAFAWLEKAYAERSYNMVNLLVEPAFDPLRSSPRFKNLLLRMRFPD